MPSTNELQHGYSASIADWKPAIVETTCKWCRLHSIKNNGRCDNCGGPQ